MHTTDIHADLAADAWVVRTEAPTHIRYRDPYGLSAYNWNRWDDALIMLGLARSTGEEPDDLTSREPQRHISLLPSLVSTDQYHLLEQVSAYHPHGLGPHMVALPHAPWHSPRAATCKPHGLTVAEVLHDIARVTVSRELRIPAIPSEQLKPTIEACEQLGSLPLLLAAAEIRS